VIAMAQQSAPAPSASAKPAASDLQSMIDTQFGTGFKIDSNFTPQTGDFDGDGEQDIAIVATGGKPLGGESGYGYSVQDPYNGYFGWGNPKITSQFGSVDGGPARRILVIHSWQKPTPKAKYVLINIPFEKWDTTKKVLKKRLISILEVQESTGMGAILLFDGKKYRWEPGDADISRFSAPGGFRNDFDKFSRLDPDCSIINPCATSRVPLDWLLVSFFSPLLSVSPQNNL
jgi:FG-GAP repeat